MLCRDATAPVNRSSGWSTDVGVSHTRGDATTLGQPLETLHGDGCGELEIVVDFDGRIDNANEVIRDCALTTDCALSDVDIVAAAYRRWGTSCFAKLVGDFAASVWEPRARLLSLARDPFGTRPLYYCCDGILARWSSTLEHLTQVVGGELAIDDEFVAGFLTTTEERERTPYRGVWSVGPGTTVVVRAGERRTHLYWDPGQDVRATGCKSDDDYEREYLVLFEQAVACRLREKHPMVAELSGGLDSSSVVCVAAEMLAAGSVGAPSMSTVSYVFSDSPTSDEMRFIDAVETYIGRVGHHIEVSDAVAPIFSGAVPSAPNPLLLFQSVFDRLKAIMIAADAPVLMTGYGGDHMMMYTAFRAPQLADLLMEGQVRTMWRLLTQFSSQWKCSYSYLLWSSVIWPLPVSLQTRFTADGAGAPEWIEAAFASRTAARERWLGVGQTGRFRTTSGQWQYSYVQDAISVVSSCYHRERIGVDVTYPYLHRPLVEFVLNTPSEQKFRPHESRSLHRRAMRGHLPERVRTRRSKASQGEVMCRGLARCWPRIQEELADLRIVRRGYVDRKKFAESLGRARYGVTDEVQPLLRALVLEKWLQGQETSGMPLNGVR